MFETRQTKTPQYSIVTKPTPIPNTEKLGYHILFRPKRTQPMLHQLSEQIANALDDNLPMEDTDPRPPAWVFMRLR
jgi:hypothetical protein